MENVYPLATLIAFQTLETLTNSSRWNFLPSLFHIRWNKLYNYYHNQQSLQKLWPHISTAVKKLDISKWNGVYVGNTNLYKKLEKFSPQVDRILSIMSYIIDQNKIGKSVPRGSYVINETEYGSITIGN